MEYECELRCKSELSLQGGRVGDNLLSGVLFHKERNKDSRGILQNAKMKITTDHQMNSKGLKKPE